MHSYEELKSLWAETHRRNGINDPVLLEEQARKHFKEQSIRVEDKVTVTYIAKALKTLKRLAWTGIGLAATLLALSVHGHCQFSQLDYIQFQNAGVNVSGGFFAYPFRLNVVGCTAASATGTLTITCSPGSGTVTQVNPATGAGTITNFGTFGFSSQTTTPTLTIGLNTVGAHLFFGNNTGSTAAPNYLQLACADLSNSGTNCASSATIPALPVSATNGGTGLDTHASTGVAQVASGTWSVSTALANGTTGTAQTAWDGSTKVATDTYAESLVKPVFNTAQSVTATASSTTTIPGSTVSMVATPVSGGHYRLYIEVKETTAGSSGTCTTGTDSILVTYTDSDTSATLGSVTASTGAQIFVPWNSTTYTTALSMIAVAPGGANDWIMPPRDIHAASTAAIQYAAFQSTASNCTNKPVFDIIPSLYYLGY